MSKFYKWTITLLLVLTVLLAGCAPAAQPTEKPAAPPAEQPTAPPAPQPTAPPAEQPTAPPVEQPTAEKPAEAPKEMKKVAALLPGAIYDKSWVQAGYEELERAKKDCNLEVAYTESVAQPEQAEIFRNYASQGYNIVIGYGGEFHDAAVSVAPEFPDVEFVLVNSKTAGPPDNVSSGLADYFGSWYLAGVMACNMTKSDKVAMLIGEELPHLKIGEKGFEMGAQTCGKKVEVKTVYNGSWVDVNKAKEAAQALIDDGYDVIKNYMDTADVGLFSAAEDAGIYTIGAYRDQSDISPKTVIGSELGAPTLMYGAACGKYVDGKVSIMDISNGADFVSSSLATAEAKAAVAKAKEDLLSGKVVRPE